MEYSAYLYPWDVVNIGVKKVVQDAVDYGLTSIDLAANYHAISTMSARPGNLQALLTETGSIFFPARTERYGRIQPFLWHDEEVLQAWPRVVEASRRAGVGINSWTVGLNQVWAATKYPDCARVLPTGDIVTANLCPASSAVHEFLGAMAADIISQFDVELVEFEGLGYLEGMVGWVQPRLLVQLTPWASWLMGLCFCRSCVAVGSSLGLDVEGVRRRVVTMLNVELSAQRPTGQTVEERLEEAETEDDQLARFVAQRRQNVVDLVSAIGSHIRSVSSRARLQVWSPLEAYGSEGAAMEALGSHLVGVQIQSPRQFPEAASQARRWADSKEGAPGKVAVLLPQPAIGVDVLSSGIFAEDIRAAKALPVDRLALYHLGLRSPKEMAAMVALARSEVAV